MSAPNAAAGRPRRRNRAARRSAATAVAAVWIAAASGCISPSGDEANPPASVGPPASVSTAPEARAPNALTELATGLDAPWSIARLDDERAVISQRDAGTIVMVDGEGRLHDVAAVDGVASGGEGGLLGLAIDEDRRSLFVYFTAANDNRVVAYDLDAGGPGEVPILGDRTEVITGIPRSRNHNGGRIAVGPDAHLYITTGDAGNPANAQDPDSLGGKILRVTPDGGIPGDNPAGSPVYSSGHRNPQGLAWDGAGRLWASEFGQNTWDELNLIIAGENYGWPEVEGEGGDDRFVDPALQWATSEASPSGMAIVDNTIVIAALRGERLWTAELPDDLPPAGAAADPASFGLTATDHFAGEHGRIRDVVPGPNGSIWFLTNNTDGRGSPGADDDRLFASPVPG